AIAVVFEGSALSYGELNRRANRLARQLTKLGAGIGDRVVILLERSVELILAPIAVLKCGAAYVPVDPAFPGDRQALMISDSEARIVICAAGMRAPEMLTVKTVHVDAAMLMEGEGDDPGVWVDSEAIAYIMYTSGSSGLPKGVLVPHRAIER